MENVRKPFQGVFNIIRFNRHFYLLAFGVLSILFFLNTLFAGTYHMYINSFLLLIIASTILSLIVSYYVYDVSNLYSLSWLDTIKTPGKSKIVNVNAGFDETSVLLKNKFKHSELIVFDFYDPKKHTEISIKRARKAYPPYPDTKTVNTSRLPLKENAVNKVFAILSAHEIRDKKERVVFFSELNRILKPSGQIMVTEHLRDMANFMAYTIGFFHFYSKRSWSNIFRAAGLCIEKEIKITPFITTFILEKNGTTS